MEGHKIWVKRLQNVLSQHIFRGFKKSYTDIYSITGGKNLERSVRLTMEGIKGISQKVLDEDFLVLERSVSREKLDNIIRNAYKAYSISSLTLAGEPVKNIKLSPTIDTGVKFVHNVYINTARKIWIDPSLLIEDKNTQLIQVIDDCIEQTIIEGLDDITNATLTEAASSRRSINTEHIGGLLESDDEDDDDEGQVNEMPASLYHTETLTLNGTREAPSNRTLGDSSMFIPCDENHPEAVHEKEVVTTGLTVYSADTIEPEDLDISCTPIILESEQDALSKRLHALSTRSEKSVHRRSDKVTSNTETCTLASMTSDRRSHKVKNSESRSSRRSNNTNLSHVKTASRNVKGGNSNS